MYPACPQCRLPGSGLCERRPNAGSNAPACRLGLLAEMASRKTRDRRLELTTMTDAELVEDGSKKALRTLASRRRARQRAATYADRIERLQALREGSYGGWWKSLAIKARTTPEIDKLLALTEKRNLFEERSARIA